MPVPLQPVLDELATLLLDPERLVRAVGAGRRRAAHPAWRRVELRPVDLASGRVLQVVTYDERQARTTNHPVGSAAAAEAVAALLAEPFGNWRVEVVDATVELRVTKKGDAQVHRTPAAQASAQASRLAPQGAPPRNEGHLPSPLGEDGDLHSLSGPGAKVARPHDRVKPRLLDPAHPFLREVGISDAQGRVKPSRQAKYRQVEDFLRQLDAVLPPPVAHEGTPSALEASSGTPHADSAGEVLRIVDLGCGNAYLTFGAYAHLVDGRGRAVELVGVDVREQARARNTELAERLGWSDHISFVAGSIADAEVATPDVVLALHACDTATDDALARAVRWRAPFVLAAPCCHHDLQRRIAKAGAPEPYGLVTRHGLLAERFADVLTDALRASVLRMLGYRVEVVEFVDSAHTPRNTLLRAVRTDAAPNAGTVRDYLELTRAWGVTPYLADALADELAPVLVARGVEVAGRSDDHRPPHLPASR